MKDGLVNYSSYYVITKMYLLIIVTNKVYVCTYIDILELMVCK